MMKKLLVGCILLIALALTGCTSLQALLSIGDFNVDKKGVEVLLLNALEEEIVYLKDGVKHSLTATDLSFTYTSYIAQFLLNETLAAGVSYDGITYFDLKNYKPLKSVTKAGVVAVTPKNALGDFYILTDQILWEYNYTKDEFTEIYNFTEENKGYYFDSGKMAYSAERNSLFYTVHLDTIKIFELDLDTKTNTERFSGKSPQLVTAENRLYFIAPDGKTLRYADLDTLTVKDLHTNARALVDYSVINENIVLFADINPSLMTVMYNPHLLLGGKVYFPLSNCKYTDSRLVNLRLSAELVEEWSQYAK